MNVGKALPSDQAARDRILSDLDTTLFVEAAAGTGKTTALVGRMVALIQAGKARLDQMVALTFTEKAAGEMKLRLRSELERAGADAPPAQRERLRGALSQLELARINTIHAFCADLLRERPVEAGVDVLFDVSPEDRSRLLIEQAFSGWFEQVVANPPEGVRRVLRRRAAGPGASGPRESLRSAAANLIDHRDFPAPWTRPKFDREQTADRLMSELEALGKLAGEASREDDYLARNLGELALFVSEVRLLERDRERDYDGLEAMLRDLLKNKRRFHWHWRGFRHTRFASLDRDEVLKMRARTLEGLEQYLEQCEQDLAPLLREELQPVVQRYEQLKRESGRLDFLDLLIRTRDLLRGSAQVREDVQQRFTHFFVDEFQDTDPLQAEILLLMAAQDPLQTDWREAIPRAGKLFLVGDPKQSIYRFRRADVQLYEQIKTMMCRHGAQLLYLSTNFRCLPALQSFVNAAFDSTMRGTGQAQYVPLEAWRAPREDRPSVIALPVPQPYGDYGKIFKWTISRSFPDAVGAFVDWLVNESSWQLEEGGEQVPIRPRHICILFRRFKSYNEDITRPYVRALETRRVPHMLVGGRSFHDREEVLAVRNALAAIEWPDDELRVFASLRGPLFALGDDALLAWRRPGVEGQLRRLHPLRPMEADDEVKPFEAQVAQALALLGELHRYRNRRPIAETITRLLSAVRAHAGVAIWPTGEQALANVLRMVDLARRFERNGAPSFRAFVEQLDAEAERGEAEDAPVVEEGTEGVRIMTAHRSKGLEFPVVILADPACQRTGSRPSRHVDATRELWAESLCGCAPKDLLDAREEELNKDDQEAVRLAYVAATRARDLLVAPVIGDERTEGWLDMMNGALYPADDRRHVATVAPNCPPFGPDSVLSRPMKARDQEGFAVRPGLHATAEGKAEVVWWDPSALRLNVEERVGLRQQRILEADEQGRAERSEEDYQRWQQQREAALANGSAPSVRVESATRLAHARAQPSALEYVSRAVQIIEVQANRNTRPSGRRFGTLVHAILAEVGLDEAAPGVRRHAKAQGRLLGASDKEVDAACVAVGDALAHPLMRRAAEAAQRAELRREVPVMLRESDGLLVEGIVDMAFREEGAWVVVDFKTDRDIKTGLAAYCVQITGYARAISEATKETTSAVLLHV